MPPPPHADPYLNDSKSELLAKRQAFDPTPPPYLEQKTLLSWGLAFYRMFARKNCCRWSGFFANYKSCRWSVSIFCKLSCKMAERLLKVSDKEVLIWFFILTEFLMSEEKGMALIIDKFCQPHQCFWEHCFLLAVLYILQQHKSWGV